MQAEDISYMPSSGLTLLEWHKDKFEAKNDTILEKHST